ncbi:tyrosine-protein phosphatase [Leucobacter sp. CSA1]|uniref:Tyrosine-protein phosphatase n=1 Tax=Leucobacter chromiisoli TaxID=2796471 RepID=A0A934UV26_9MICO|nr:tyrosine-protein phosphatase [Leucobacter chromiisoli]MBK0419450.1 tyrosine-protein phosphatase [Leucobacter chromiisoli]
MNPIASSLTFSPASAPVAAGAAPAAATASGAGSLAVAASGAAPRIGAPIPVEGTYNFRSPGGYAAAGGAIRTGSLFRSDALHLLSPLGVEQFGAQGIARVIDLRDGRERLQAPSALAAGAVETIHHPIFEGAAIPTTGPAPTLREVYRTIATDRVHALSGAVRLIADAPEGGVLVHCTAGKDRTGMVVAVALASVGVSRDDVLADYAASAANLAGAWVERMIAAAAERFPGPIDDAVRELIAASPAEALDEALDVIDDRYGSAERMLIAAGFDDDALARLRTRLVA